MSGAADQRAQMAGAPPPSGNPQEEEQALTLLASYAEALLEIGLEVIAKSPNLSAGSQIHDAFVRAAKDLSGIVDPKVVSQLKAQILGAGQRAPQGVPQRPPQGAPQGAPQGVPQQPQRNLQEAMF
jgi:hypothetical protein